jgi:VCBS repeat-containing protein
VNDAPFAGDNAYTVAEDELLTVNAPGVRDNDGDVDGGTPQLVLLTTPAQGAFQINEDGSFTYRGPSNFHGTTSFTYQLNDGLGGVSPTATVTLTVTPVNDAPFAGNRSSTGFEDTPETLNVQDIASDVDGDPLTIASVTQPAHGTATISADGTKVTYTPALNYNGPDSFTFTVSDGNGGSATGSLSWTLAPVDDPPVGVSDAYTTDEDTPLNVPTATGVLANDIDVDGDGLGIVSFTQPAHGAVGVNADGSFGYAPAPGYNGPDSFTYRLTDGLSVVGPVTVSINVRPVNDAPDAVNDSATTAEDTAVDIAVLANDTDPDGDTLTVASVTQGTRGAVTVTADGTVKYTPNPNFHGTDSFTYTVSDGNGGSDTATVAVTVTPVNDAPVANPDTYTTDEDTRLDVAAPGVLGNDTDVDGDTLTVELVTGPTRAAGFTLNANGSFTYTPAPNFNGADGFTYKVNDGNGGTATGTVTLNVRSVNDAPDAINDAATTNEDTAVTIPVLNNDTDADGDTLTISRLTQGANGAVTVNADGTVKYTPAANFHGADSFTYTVSDGNGGTDTATVAVTVTPVNDVPLAGNDVHAVDEDQTLTAAAPGVLGNDTDADGDTLTAAVATGPAHAAGFTLNPNGSFTYTPTANYHGADSFTYTVSDGNGGTATGTVTLNVRSVNDLPVAVADGYSVNEDGSLSVPVGTGVLANDTDADGDTLSAVLVSGPANAAGFTLNANGSFTYVPAANFFGSDSFKYKPNDGTADGNTVTVALSVNPVNDAPTFTGGANQAVLEDSGPRTVVGWATGISAGPANEAGQALAFAVVENTNLGLFSAAPAVAANGTLTFTPAPNATGSATVRVRLQDNGGTENGGVDQSPIHTFTITVSPRTQVADVTVNRGEVQRSRVTEIAVTFDTIVTLDAGAFTLTRTGGGSVRTVTVRTAVVDGRTVATLTFSRTGTEHGSLVDGLWTLRVVAARVREASTGQPMPADFTYGLHRLFGDSNGDRRVDSVDRTAFDAALGTRTGQAGYVHYFDFDLNGAIERRDRDQFNSRYGRSL